jgi:hypothetical protein|tara:strand:+ start:130 stop:687 length:558 start_codon:yes stop_codon:yes gene_type:complete
MKRIWDKTELERVYLSEKKTLREIGVVYGVTHEAIRLRLQYFNIKLRNRGLEKGSKIKRPQRWNSLERYLQERITNTKYDVLGVIPKYLLPDKSTCSDCHRQAPHIQFHHIKYPARKIDDFIILCASCHKTRHIKGITWDKQCDIYKRYLSGVSTRKLALEYNISLSMVYKIIAKIRNNTFSLKR